MIALKILRLLSRCQRILRRIVKRLFDLDDVAEGLSRHAGLEDGAHCALAAVRCGDLARELLLVLARRGPDDLLADQCLGLLFVRDAVHVDDHVVAALAAEASPECADASVHVFRG